VGKRQFGRMTLQPGESAVIPLGKSRSNTWRVVQATEPETIKAAIRITFGRALFGNCPIPAVRVLRTRTIH
jgi:hypothetical protein